MADNNSSSYQIFGVSAKEGQYDVNADYAVYPEVVSEDFSLSVALSGGYYNVGVTVRTDVSPYSMDALLTIIGPIKEEDEDGVHTLEWTSHRTGILAVNNGRLEVIPFSEMGIMTGDAGGCGWVGAPDGHAIFGRSGAGWGWFGVSECEDPCKDTE